MGMRHIASSRRRLFGLALALILVPAFASNAHADSYQTFRLSATGQIVSQVPCGPTLVCQTAQISGKATKFGNFTGVFFETVDVTTGSYTGTGSFTTTAGETLNTEYVGQVSPADRNGTVVFVENHEIVGGTGQFAGATGRIAILGRANATGGVSIDGVGVVSR